MEISLDTIRYMVGGYFVLLGFLQIIYGKSYELYALDHGVVNTSQTVKFAALALIVLGIVVMLPGVSRYGFYGLGIYLVISALSIHKFWDCKDAPSRVAEGLQFGKNIGLAILLYGMTLV